MTTHRKLEVHTDYKSYQSSKSHKNPSWGTMEKAQHRGQSQKSGYYKMQKSSKPLETLKSLLSAKWKTAAQKMSQKTKRLLQMQKSSNPPETLQTFLSAMVEGPMYGGMKEGGKQTNNTYLLSVLCQKQKTTAHLPPWELLWARARCQAGRP